MICIVQVLVCLIVLNASNAFLVQESRRPIKRQILPVSTARWLSSNQEPSSSSTSRCSFLHLEEIDRVLCISDLHTDHADNMEWVANVTAAADATSSQSGGNRMQLKESDLVVVAGDISHDLQRIEQALGFLIQTGAQVLFVVGNHEAWLTTKEIRDDPENASSLAKLDQIYETCRSMGVHTDTLCVGGTPERPHRLWLVPMQSWYDGSLAIPELEELCTDFGKWPWFDFLRCQWPGFEPMGPPNKRIPKGLVDYFLKQNEAILHRLPTWMSQVASAGEDDSSSPPQGAYQTGLMTISHFLPNQQCLPDWKDVEEPIFDREHWLDHGGGGVSAKFAKVAGTARLDEQIRGISLEDLEADRKSKVRRIHVFGHSHRPKDFEYQGIRYIHNPLGKPREREIYMVAPDVDFRVVWETCGGGEVVAPNPIIRLWEEQGGGVEALIQRMANSKRKSRYGKYLKKPKSDDSDTAKTGATSTTATSLSTPDK